MSSAIQTVTCLKENVYWALAVKLILWPLTEAFVFVINHAAAWRMLYHEGKHGDTSIPLSRNVSCMSLFHILSQYVLVLKFRALYFRNVSCMSLFHILSHYLIVQKFKALYFINVVTPFCVKWACLLSFALKVECCLLAGSDLLYMWLHVCTDLKLCVVSVWQVDAAVYVVYFVCSYI